MLLHLWTLLHLWPNVITLVTFITFVTSYYICAFNSCDAKSSCCCCCCCSCIGRIISICCCWNWRCWSMLAYRRFASKSCCSFFSWVSSSLSCWPFLPVLDRNNMVSMPHLRSLFLTFSWSFPPECLFIVSDTFFILDNTLLHIYKQRKKYKIVKQTRIK